MPNTSTQILKYGKNKNDLKHTKMKSYFTFFLFFAFLCFYSQKIDKVALKICRDTFSRKFCFSDEDEDGVLFYLDNCPKIVGTIDNNGCPWKDTDGDQVIDKDDVCPEIKGLPKYQGCPLPDMDEDGILDKDDACPTVPGYASDDPYKNGCMKQDCKKLYEEEQERLRKLQEEARETDYTTLADKIIKDIDFGLLKEKNLIFLVNSVFLECGTVPGRQYSCNISHDATPIYKTNDFWTQETIMKIFNKTNKNFTLGILYDGMGNGIAFEEIPENISKLNVQSKKIKIFKDGLEKEVSLYYKINNNQPIKKFSALLINIDKNDFGKKVNVEVIYTTYYSDKSIRYNVNSYNRKHLTYQYISNQWKLIE